MGHSRFNAALARAALLALALAAAPGPPPAAAENPDQGASAQRLAELRRRISELAARLRADLSARDRVSAELREVERRSGALEAEIRALDERLGEGERRLATLRARREAARRDLAALLDALARQLRTGYAIGRRDELKLLLNLERPATLSRVLAYHGYFARARARRIAALRVAIGEMRELADSIARANAALAALRADKDRARARLAGERERRAGLLARIEGTIADRSRRLERLQADEKRLTELLASLARELADIPLEVDRAARFAARKGRLPWPVAGRLRRAFGTPRPGGTLTWKGVLVAAPRGAPVRAIHRGRVAYADWLRGYGLLLIIDHGEGFMTLYGHNQSLFKEAGDWVEDGELIATVGDSGGISEPGLYFEIRRRGRPINPRRWLARAAPRQSAAGTLVRPE